MSPAVWLAAPYLSVMLICRWPVAGRRVAAHTAITLPLGWLAVLGVFGAVVGAWTLPLPVLAVLGGLSGLAMLTAAPGDDEDDGGGEDDDEDPSPELDWDRFDEERRHWERAPLTHA